MTKTAAAKANSKAAAANTPVHPTASRRQQHAIAAAAVAVAFISAVYLMPGDTQTQSSSAAATDGIHDDGTSAAAPRASDDPPPTAAAVKLAALINRGDPVDVREHMTEQELDEALGTVVEGPHGWRRRVGSFLPLLEPIMPERWAEEDIVALSRSGDEAKELLASTLFGSPLLITRRRGGVSRVATDRMTLRSLRKVNPMVRPSRASTLAVAYGPTPRGDDGEWNEKLMPFHPDCPEWWESGSE